MAEADKFDFDVFISYSSKDKAWVRGELLNRIEQAGLKAFIDFRDFTRGTPSIKECEYGAKKCRNTLVILTPNYLKSEWGEFEVEVVQTLTPANRKQRLIPLLKTPCKPPTRINRLTHIDFTDGADLELAWRQLLTALGKPPEPEAPMEPPHDDWFLAHPYPMPPNFTGRVDERAMLTHWLTTDPEHQLLVLQALGGFGKSALTWHWLTHDVPPAVWPRVVWWSFYEGNASFDQFLAETLHYLSGGRIQPDKRSGKIAVITLLQLLHEPGTLLVLDGFERVLRAFGGLNAAYQGDEVAAGVPPAVEGGVPPPGTIAGNSSTIKSSTPCPPGGTPGSTAGGDARRYNDCDCLSPLADLFLYHIALQPHLRSKVLLTTRLCPRVLEARGGGCLQGCREEELLQMQPADAVAFFHAQGIRGTHTEIEEACAPYGYHPLSLRLLAGLIVGDFQQPGDVAAAKRLDVSGDLIQRQNHVLQVAYDRLTPVQQVLLARIACFRSPVKYEALKALAESGGSRREEAQIKSVEGESEQPKSAGNEDKNQSLVTSSPTITTLDADLRDLVARGLLHHDTKDGRFDLHPIVRRYTYDRLAAPDRAAAHTRLRDYFATVPQPDKVTRLEDLAPVIELYHHTVRAGQYDEARTLFSERLNEATYFQFGAYLLQIDLLRALFPDGEDRPPRLKAKNAQAWTLNALANSYSLSGQPRRAVPLYEVANNIGEEQGDKNSLAIGLGNLGNRHMNLGALRAAEANKRRSIALGQEIEYEFNEAVGHQELGRLLAYRGAYAEAETELATALKMFEKRKRIQWQGIVWAYRAERELLLLRSTSDSSLITRHSPLNLARRALELADETARTSNPYERDYIRAHWLLGAAYRVASQTDEAERHLHEALERCRNINMVDYEADILIDLARLRAATNQPDEARRLAEEALLITERSGYALQGADAHLELAKLALARGDRAAAKDHAQQAKTLATCDGPPDYTYKAAYDEANGLLATLPSK